MTTEVTTETTAPAPTKANLTPQEFLATLPGSPTPEQIETWKSQSPNGRVKVLTLDGKTAFIIRGLNGLELSQIQKGIQQMATPTADPDLETQIACDVKATLWTNASPTGKLTDVILRTGPAGRPSTLFTVVTELSEFTNPQQVDAMSADL
jgi:hypothetical protein